MENLMNFYELLGVSYYATSDEIKEAYRKKVKETHPDKDNGDSERFKLIIEAYEVLSNDEKRKRYDDILFKVTKFNVMVAVPKKEKEGALPKKGMDEKKEKRTKVWGMTSFLSLFVILLLIGIIIYLNNQYQMVNKNNSLLDGRLTSMIKENQNLENDNGLLDSRLTSMTKENQVLGNDSNQLDIRLTSLIKENEDLSAKVDSLQKEKLQKDNNIPKVQASSTPSTINPVKESNLSFVTLGSTENQVTAILGSPIRIQFQRWYYENDSWISFDYFEKTVNGWNNDSGELKVK